MTEHATGSFKIQSWDEQPQAEFDGGTKLTRASVTQGFSGDLEGSAATESVSFYRADRTADIVGLQRFEGTLAGRRGSFVLQSVATFDGTTAKGTVLVVPDSGTGELSGLSGRGEWSAVSGPDGELTLDYELS